MSHRYGHVDGTNTYASMGRRKYLGAMAATAALGAVAACGGGRSNDNTDEGDHDHDHHLSKSDRQVMQQFGYLSIFPPGILTFDEAKKNMPTPGSKLIRLPFFNHSKVEVKEKMVVGFHIVRIGCPSIFAVAFNLITDTKDLKDDIDSADRDVLIKRNMKMDEVLRAMGYVEVEWKEREQNCPAPEPLAD